MLHACTRCSIPTSNVDKRCDAHPKPKRRRGNAWKPIVRAVLARDRYRCQLAYDGCTGAATLADHIVPRAQGGTDHPSNLRAACAPCNLKRGAWS